MSGGGMGNSGGATNPFVRRQQTYSQNGLYSGGGQAQGMYGQQQAYRSPFMGGFQNMGMPKGYGGRTMFAQNMGSQLPPQLPAPPVGNAPPPPGYQEPTPAPVPQQPAPIPQQPTPQQPQPAPQQPAPQPAPNPTGAWGQGGPYGGGAGGLMPYNTAMMFDPRAGLNKPTDTSLGFNGMTGQWEPFK